MPSSDEEEEETLLLGNNNEKTAETEAKTQCKDLALFDTTTTTKSEQDSIELLSLTLSTTALPSPQTQTQPPPNTSFLADDQFLMNSYVVPWAHSQAEAHVPKKAGPQFQQQQQFSYGYPQPQWNGGQANSNDTKLWSQGGNENKVFERNLHYSNPLPPRGAGPSGAAMDGQVQQQRPYVPPYKLFEDLNVFWNGDGGVRSSK